MGQASKVKSQRESPRQRQEQVQRSWGRDELGALEKQRRSQCSQVSKGEGRDEVKETQEVGWQGGPVWKSLRPQ